VTIVATSHPSGRITVDGKKLLVPIDGSEDSLRALAYVITRARTERDLRIVLINVQAPLRPSPFVTRAMIEEHYATKSAQALAKALELLRTQHDVIVAIGKPAESIIEFATRKMCEKIVIGTRGLGSFLGWLLDSITTKVIHLAQVPVTVVGRHAVGRISNVSSGARRLAFD
jgi:nucleotide-binding universal stress UspA family protein